MSDIFSSNSIQYTLDESITALTKHCKNKSKFTRNSASIMVGGTDNSDYSNKSIRRTRASQKYFKHCIFRDSAAAGSNFYDCIFEQCKIENANFQECSFIKSKLLNEEIIIHSNFNESLFSDDFVIENNTFKHSVFYNTAFIDGKILNTTFYSSTLENTTFSNVLMKNVTFTDLNIDYAVFENVTMKNVILPFSQICYTFGLLSYLNETTDEVYITSNYAPKGFISPSEYLNLIPYFIKYYTESKEYFPLANIYFYMGEEELAKEIILQGILEGVTEIDFRKIKYLCKLIYTYGVFSYHERYDIITYIYSHISFFSMHSSLLYNFKAYKNEIEGYLLSNNKKNIVTMEVNIFTNIFPEEQKKLGVLLSTIEEIIELNKSRLGEHQIVCRHNSAESIFVLVQDEITAIIAIISTFYTVLVAHYALREKRISFGSAKLEKKLALDKLQLEIETQKEQLINLRLENQLKQKQLEQLESEELKENNIIKEQILQKNISENNIEITEVNHIIFGNIPPEIDKDFIQYRYHKS